MFRLAVVTLILLISPSAHAQEDAARLIAECDRLAASDVDPDRPKSIPGVPSGQINAAAALPACMAATRVAPTNPRVLFQLGRAYQAAGQHDRAQQAYELASELSCSIAAADLQRLRNAPQPGPAVRVPVVQRLLLP
jgi:Tetratricopeptide repeat